MPKRFELVTPDGRVYVTQDEREAIRLQRTAGYKPKSAAKAKAATAKDKTNTD